MAWRLLMRRCPSRSMTIVGDVAQTGALAGTAVVGTRRSSRTWRSGGGWTELTVNYRTPAEIMAVAADVLAAIDPALQPAALGAEQPACRRGTGRCRAGRFAAELVEAAAARGGGARRRAARRDRARRPGGRAGRGRDRGAARGGASASTRSWRSRVVVLTVAQAKGLEFDSVLVVDPERIVAESPRGHNDLYVALTRATQRLGVLRIDAPAPTA